MPVEVEVIGREAFVGVSRAMKRADPDLRREMFKAMRTQVTKPILLDMRRSALEMGVYGTGAGPQQQGGKGGLRRAIAMSVRNVVKDSGQGSQVGVRVESVGSRIDRGPHSDRLGVYANKGFWRHPVFKREIKSGRIGWTTTTTTGGWFDEPADRGMDKANSEFQEVVRVFATRLAAQMSNGG